MTGMAAVGLAALLLLVAGCGGGGPNDADVEFSTAMVVHHAQAIQMASYSIGKDGVDPRVARLAEEIRVSQTRQIDALARLQRGWGEEVPETGFATATPTPTIPTPTSGATRTCRGRCRPPRWSGWRRPGVMHSPAGGCR